MKRILAIIAACLMLTACSAKTETASNPYDGVEPDFRNVNWGMTVDEVMAREEGEAVIKDNGTIKYSNQTVIDLDCSLEYQFYSEGNRLNGAEYRINTDKLSHKTIHDSYKKLLEQLTQKYGDPEVSYFSLQDTKDNFYFDISDPVPADMQFRSASYYASWHVENLDIVLNVEMSGASPQWMELKYRAEIPAEIDENI